MDDLSLESRLSAQSSYRLGEPIVVQFEISNRSEQIFRLLTWDTPLAQHPLNFLSVTRDGEDLQYDGPRVKRGDPSDEDYLTLGPGETRRAETDISRLYPITEPGEYTATL